MARMSPDAYLLTQGHICWSQGLIARAFTWMIYPCLFIMSLLLLLLFNGSHSVLDPDLGL